MTLHDLIETWEHRALIRFRAADDPESDESPEARRCLEATAMVYANCAMELRKRIAPLPPEDPAP